MPIKVMGCSCQHAFQDSQYGKGQRVHNSIKVAQGQAARWRCTVCGNVKG